MTRVRTQIYLTPEQRARIDDVMRSEGKSLAQIVREAIDAYLGGSRPDARKALDATFGALPDLTVPARREWDRG